MSLRRLLALVLSLALVVAAVRPVDARCATSAGAMSGMAMEHGRSHHAPPVGHGAAPTDCAASLHCASAAPTIAAPIVAVVAVGIDEARATGALLAATDAPIEPEFPPPRG